MKSDKILVQVNSSFDLYICTSLVIDKRNKFSADLMLPHTMYEKLPLSISKSYDQIYGFEPSVRNLLSKSALFESTRLTRWAEKNKNEYRCIIFGAYRNDITSLLSKHFKGNADLITIKQGIDLSEGLYKRYHSIGELHDDIYYRIFGYSSFFRERLKNDTDFSQKDSDYIFRRPVWKKDPFRKNNIFTIGRRANDLSDDSKFVMPDFDFIRKQSTRSPSEGIFVIGERTPMTPNWNKDKDKLMSKIFDQISVLSKDEPIYIRPRKHLTNDEFYSNLKPELLDQDQLFDDQLLEVNPRIVISVKSTGAKTAAYYGYPSALLYPLLGFSDAESLHLQYLFGDGAPINYINTFQDLELFLSQEPKSSDEDFVFSADANKEFFDSLNEN